MYGLAPGSRAGRYDFSFHFAPLSRSALVAAKRAGTVSAQGRVHVVNIATSHRPLRIFAPLFAVHGHVSLACVCVGVSVCVGANSASHSVYNLYRVADTVTASVTQARGETATPSRNVLD